MHEAAGENGQAQPDDAPPSAPAEGQEEATAAAPTVWRHASAQLLWILLPVVIWSLYVGDPRGEPIPQMDASLKGRLAYYDLHKEEFDLVWIGDSRTLCGMHPDRLDPLLNTRSLNLAVWANWFPTQYPFMKDLVPKLRPGTTVVWSIGDQNFRPVNSIISKQYAIPLSDVPLYLSLGLSWDSLRPNLLEHSLLGAPVRPLLGTATGLRSKFDAYGARVLHPAPVPQHLERSELSEQAERLVAELQKDPRNLYVRIVYHQGKPTSVMANRSLGGYIRHEIDHEFFRAQQRKTLEASLGAPPAQEFQADPARWQLFVRLLEFCKQHEVRLIVNEVEEAPNMYGQPGSRAARRRFMKDKVQAEVERQGFRYTRPDYDRLSDEHYFDYNHLNRRGVDAYSPLLAEALRPAL